MAGRGSFMLLGGVWGLGGAGSSESCASWLGLCIISCWSLSLSQGFCWSMWLKSKSSIFCGGGGVGCLLRLNYGRKALAGK